MLSIFAIVHPNYSYCRYGNKCELVPHNHKAHTLPVITEKTFEDGTNLVYTRSTVPQPYRYAFAWCHAQGGKLPTPDSAEENKFLKSLGSTHLGIHIGKFYRYVNWRFQEPSGDGFHVALLAEKKWGKAWNGKWNDQPSNTNHAFPTTCYLHKSHQGNY